MSWYFMLMPLLLFQHSLKNVTLIQSELNKMNIAQELEFKTARSGGKGGQNVNKVETMVEGRWNVSASTLLTGEQKQVILQKLANRITGDGYLLVKSQTERTQSGNKALVIKRMNELIRKALIKKKPRIATKLSRVIKEKRIDNKKRQSVLKGNRKRRRPDEW
jgi:ribosome-associated protein